MVDGIFAWFYNFTICLLCVFQFLLTYWKAHWSTEEYIDRIYIDTHTHTHIYNLCINKFKRLTVHSGYTCFVCVFLGIEPTTFCAANAMLYNWATGEQQCQNNIVLMFPYLLAFCFGIPWGVVAIFVCYYKAWNHCSSCYHGNFDLSCLAWCMHFHILCAASNSSYAFVHVDGKELRKKVRIDMVSTPGMIKKNINQTLPLF